jgi:membrane fusion protein (multidrug efflux system)
MKLTLSLLTLIIVFVTGCGNKNEGSIEELIQRGDITEIRTKKKEITNSLKALEDDIALLDSIIGAKDGNNKLPLVTTFKVKSQSFNHYVELQGDVTTKQNVLIYPEMPGALLNVYVEKGQSVSKGQLLATIADGGMSSQLQQMKTQLILAKTTFERQKRLWDQKIGTEIQYLQAKTNYDAQVNSVNQMESQLGKYRVTAPFAGIIDDVIQDQGTVVGPGGPGSEIFRIVNLSNMYIEVDVPESYITSITQGKYVKVFFPILNETIESKVRQTGNFINPNNRSFSVEIAVPNKEGRIKPNLTAKVQINDYKNSNAILIPQSIISENAEGEQYAYIVSDVNGENLGVAKKNIIVTGKTQDDYVEILSGILDGDNVIKEGARSVKDGQQVKIITE